MRRKGGEEIRGDGAEERRIEQGERGREEEAGAGSACKLSYTRHAKRNLPDVTTELCEVRAYLMLQHSHVR